MLTIITIILFVAGFALVLMLVLKLSAQMNSQMNQLNQQLGQQLNSQQTLLNQQLSGNASVLLKTQQDITQRLNKLSDVEKSITKMEETYKQVLEVAKDISSLQDLLRAPKFRGEIGEFGLENLLSQILPSDFYSLQYGFKNGTKADAVIRMGGNLVAIDAKFPLESFKRMIVAQSEQDRLNQRRQFIRDVQNRIDEISTKYILPDEKTYDFALMFIPAENVYYETILKDMQEKDNKSLYSYALAKKVIPVSPHSLYPYLMVILRGLKGLTIEKNAKVVFENLQRLQVDLGKFKEDFRLIGGHLTNARVKYEEAERRLDRFSDKLTSSGQAPEQLGQS